MKLGILGTGMIVKDLMKVFGELGIEKTYLLGTLNTKEETESLVNDNHLDQAFYDYDELLQSDVDTIYCALPNHLHYAFSKKAILHGKNVIIEKPITSNSSELEDLIQLAKKQNVMIFEAMNIHYLPSFISLKEDIRKIGDIKIVIFNYSQYSSRYNAFKEGNILPAFDFHKSGGALMDLNVYNIHSLIGLFGTPINHQYYANIEQNIDTSGMMLFNYPSFKAVTIGAKDCKAPITCTIQGNLGTIIISTPLNQLTEYKILYNDGTYEERIFEKKHRMYYEFIEMKRMILDKDYLKQESYLQLSLEISKLMESARKQQNIIFDNDIK